jgi:hypothetical protein
MMINLRHSLSHFFSQAHQAFGSLSGEYLPPRSTWVLPAGLSYDPSLDCIVNLAGDCVDPSGYLATGYFAFVPAAETREEQLLTALGIIPSGTLTIAVRAEDLAFLRQAHALKIGSRWFNVAEISEFPPGQPAVALLRLTVRS